MKSFLPSIKNSQNGQVVLIVLLISAVIVTIGLSVVSRSVTDVKISQQNQESARAFWVAQAGLEKALKTNSGQESGSDLGNDVNYVVDKTTLQGSTLLFKDANAIRANEPITLWLINHDTNGNPDPSGGFNGHALEFCWGVGLGQPADYPALEISVIYKKINANEYVSKKWTFDPNVSRNNHFSNEVHSCSDVGQGLSFSTNPILIDNAGYQPYLARVRMLYNSVPQTLFVKTDTGSLPVQGNCFVSTGTVEASGVKTKLQQCQLWPDTPSIFDYVLFSGGGIQ